MSKSLLLASASLGLILAAAPAMADWNLTTAAGLNPSGPEYLITFAANGSISTALNPIYTTDPGPYDGSDDTYFGVINNTSSAITFFNLSSSNDIGGFDGDGVSTYANFSPTGVDTTGYGAHDAFYTNNTGFSLTVNFGGGGISAGGTDVFSLEEPASLVGPPIISTPEPATWAMMLIGFAGIGFAAYRKARPSVSVA